MIPIKIKKKKYKIKSINELNTKEFIELSKIDELDFIKYISWQTGFKMKDAFFATMSESVENAIGLIPDITKLPKSNQFDYKKIIDTVGQRHQVKQCNKKDYELLVFILAVSQAKSVNIDDVNKLYEQYLSDPFTEILPSGFFFFRILQSGKRSGLSYLKKLLSSMRILRLKKARA